MAIHPAQFALVLPMQPRSTHRSRPSAADYMPLLACLYLYIYTSLVYSSTRTALVTYLCRAFNPQNASKASTVDPIYMAIRSSALITFKNG